MARVLLLSVCAENHLDTQHGFTILPTVASCLQGCFLKKHHAVNGCINALRRLFRFEESDGHLPEFHFLVRAAVVA